MSTTLRIAVCPKRSRTKALVTQGERARLKPNLSQPSARSRPLPTSSATIVLGDREKNHAVLLADASAGMSGTRLSRVLVVAIEPRPLFHRDAVPGRRRRHDLFEAAR